MGRLSDRERDRLRPVWRVLFFMMVAGVAILAIWLIKACTPGGGA